MKEQEQTFWRAVLRIPDNQSVEAWIRDHSEHLPNGNMAVDVSDKIFSMTPL